MEYMTNSRLTITPRERPAQQSACERYGTRVQVGHYIADIVPDDEENPSVHHCIVQRLGSPTVLYLGQEDTFAAALESGYRRLEELAGARPRKPAAIYQFKVPEPK
jgi:hypothetical protein